VIEAAGFAPVFRARQSASARKFVFKRITKEAPAQLAPPLGIQAGSKRWGRDRLAVHKPMPTTINESAVYSPKPRA
jgi:hypothetical protein